MGLCKKITALNGVELNYHRVVSVNSITNQQIIIEIASYLSQDKRLEEKEKISNNETMNIFIEPSVEYAEYNENFNVVSAYHYLKSLDKFTGASDC